MKNKLITLSLLPFAVASLVSCKHADDDIASTSSKTIKVYYTDVVLDWDHNTFTHGDFRVSIPEKWGAGVLGQRSKFVEYDPHDIVFSYDLITSKTYGGDTLYKVEFKELEKEAIEKTDKEIAEKKKLAETIKKAKEEGKKIEYMFVDGHIKPVIVDDKLN